MKNKGLNSRRKICHKCGRNLWIKNDFYEDALMCSCCRAYLGREDWSSHNFYFCYHYGAFMEGMDRGPDMRGGGGNVE